MMMINYNCGADLSLAAQIKHGRNAKWPNDMGTLFRLGTSRFFQEFRLIDLPESVHSHWAIFISAVLRRYNSAQVGVTERVKAIQHLQGMLHYQPRSAGRESNKGHICSLGIA